MKYGGHNHRAVRDTYREMEGGEHSGRRLVDGGLPPRAEEKSFFGASEPVVGDLSASEKKTIQFGLVRAVPRPLLNMQRRVCGNQTLARLLVPLLSTIAEFPVVRSLCFGGGLDFELEYSPRFKRSNCRESHVSVTRYLYVVLAGSGSNGEQCVAWIRKRIWYAYHS